MNYQLPAANKYKAGSQDPITSKQSRKKIEFSEEGLKIQLNNTKNRTKI